MATAPRRRWHRKAGERWRSGSRARRSPGSRPTSWRNKANVRSSRELRSGGDREIDALSQAAELPLPGAHRNDPQHRDGRAGDEIDEVMAALGWTGQDDQSVENNRSSEQPSVMAKIVGQHKSQHGMKRGELDQAFGIVEAENMHCTIAQCRKLLRVQEIIHTRKPIVYPWIARRQNRSPGDR